MPTHNGSPPISDANRWSYYTIVLLGYGNVGFTTIPIEFSVCGQGATQPTFENETASEQVTYHGFIDVNFGRNKDVLE